MNLKQLIDHFKEFSRFQDPTTIEYICRYLVENDWNGDVIEYDLNADIDKIALGKFHINLILLIVSKFKNKMVEGDYTIFDEDNPTKKGQVAEIKNEISSIFESCFDTFQEALDYEDSKSNGYLSIDQFKGVIRNLGFNFTKLHIEYMIYEMYKVSENSRKLLYPYLLNMFSKEDNNNFVDEDLEEDSYFSESIKDNNKSNKNINNQEEENKETAHDLLPTETQDGFENQQKNNGVVPSQGSEEGVNDTNAQIETENNQFESEKSLNEGEGVENLGEGEGENDDEFINDEEMINIAETCLMRISHELKQQNFTIHQLFGENIMCEEIEGQKIELLAPIHFLEGLKKLGIDDFSELDVACLVNLLTRQELDDLILIDELDILRDASKLRELIADMHENSQHPVTTEEAKEEEVENPEGKKKKGMNFDQIGERSI